MASVDVTKACPACDKPLEVWKERGGAMRYFAWCEWHDWEEEQPSYMDAEDVADLHMQTEHGHQYGVVERPRSTRGAGCPCRWRELSLLLSVQAPGGSPSGCSHARSRCHAV